MFPLQSIIRNDPLWSNVDLKKEVSLRKASGMKPFLDIWKLHIFCILWVFFCHYVFIAQKIMFSYLNMWAVTDEEKLDIKCFLKHPVNLCIVIQSYAYDVAFASKTSSWVRVELSQSTASPFYIMI